MVFAEFLFSTKRLESLSKLFALKKTLSNSFQNHNEVDVSGLLLTLIPQVRFLLSKDTLYCKLQCCIFQDKKGGAKIVGLWRAPLYVNLDSKRAQTISYGSFEAS